MIGQTISHYKILEKLGEGGMGVVYKAEDTKLHRTVALKFLPQDKLASRADSVRFAREARAAASLNHPNIATIFEFNEVEDTASHTTEAFIAMEYVEGTTLQEMIKRGPLPLDLVASIALQLATALQTAHRKSIVHRDLKPGNVIITPDGVAKILDFGVSKLIAGDITTTSAKFAGSPAYMSPEQAQGGHVDQRSDLFSLGVVLYEMVSGRHPFTGEHNAQVLYAIVNVEPESLSKFRKDSPKKLEALIHRLLQKDPSRRYQSAGELLADLEDAPRPAESAGKLHLSSLFRRSWRYALAGILVIGGLLYLAQRVADDRRSDKLRDVAVLPFINIDQDVHGQAFCDGLVEILTSKLTELQRFQRSISVVPAAEIRNRKITTPSDAYKTLGASLVVTGSVQRVTERIRLTLTITDAIEIRQLQSVVVDDPLTNVAAFQDGIVTKLASMLDVELRPQTVRFLASDSTTNPRAYTHFLEAKGFMQRGLKSRRLDTAIALFMRALDEDPQYTDAYAGLASAYEALGQYTKAESVQQQAVKNRPDSWRAYNDLGLFFFRRARFEDAVTAFGRVTDLSPDNIRGHNNLAGVLLYLQRYDDAHRALGRSLALQPNYVALSLLGGLQFYEGLYEEAASTYEQSLKMNDRDYRVWGSLASAQYWGHQRPKALENYAAAVRLGEEKRMFEPQNAKLLSYLADFYSMIQQKDSALALIEQALAIPPPDAEIMARAAEVYEQLGIRDKALQWIQNAMTHGYPVTLVERSPGLAELRKDERFKLFSRK